MNQAFRQWCKELGLSTDIEGRHLLEVFPFLPERVRDECRQVFETGRSLITEETTAVGGHEYVTETRKIPVFEGGRVVRLITIVRDITDRRKLDQELLKAQKLESISLLAGGIAHDFNNLLTGIVSSIDFARHELGPEARLSGILGEAQRAAGRARSLVQRLLTFSGGGAPVKQPVHLAPVLRETAELALAGSSVRCECHMPEDLWAVDADPDQISQVVQNLLVNARQAMPGCGGIEVSAENVEVPPDTPLPLDEGRYVKLAVRDHGVGIPREHLPRVFDPFFTTREGGSGLGLAVSYSIVRKHGGCIEVQSDVGVGTTFRVYLPAAEAAGLERPRAALPAGQGRVLLMDDDDIVRKGARRLLAERGYDVECARDGTVALELYRKARDGGQPFDAVILDLTVPDGMGGEECLARLRELDPQVRAIACSGYSEDSVLAQFREHGFQGLVRKPFTIEDLHGELHRLITEHPISTNFTTLSPPGSGRDGSGGAM
jgi:signal transduction histidine kinase/CheY-like chemotaxis protein